MKLMTIALAGALALSSTFALAQSRGGGAGMSGAGSSVGGSAATGGTPGSVNGSSMVNRPGSTTGMAGGTRAGPNTTTNSIGKHARPVGLAQRIDIDADGARLGSQPIVTYKR